MITPVWIAGFTGHRPKDAPGRTKAELERLGPVIREQLEKLQEKAAKAGGRVEFFCGVAAGADLVAARAAESLHMPVHVILPMPEDEYARDFADMPGEWATAKSFIDRARRGEDGATLRISTGAQLRDECYYDLGTEIVEASDAVIACWDEIAAPEVKIDESAPHRLDGRGGTADVVDLARADRMPFVTGEKASRDRQWLPTPLILINSLTGIVTGDASAFARENDAGLVELRFIAKAARAEHGTKTTLKTAEELFKFVNQGANDWAVRLRRALVVGSTLHFLASLTGTIAAGLQKVKIGVWTPPALALVELSLVFIAIGVMLWMKWKQAQARWLELRLATELMRGILAAGRSIDPLRPVAGERLPSWRRFCLSVGLVVWRSAADAAKGASGTETVIFDRDAKRYLEERVLDQHGHFTKYNPSERHRRFLLITRFRRIASTLAVIFIMVALCRKYLDARTASVLAAAATSTASDLKLWESVIYYFLPVFFPLVAGTMALMQNVNDTGRRAHVYPEMMQRLAAARDMLPAVRTPAAMRRFVRRTEEMLLDELLGWYAAAKNLSH